MAPVTRRQSQAKTSRESLVAASAEAVNDARTSTVDNGESSDEALTDISSAHDSAQPPTIDREEPPDDALTDIPSDHDSDHSNYASPVNSAPKSLKRKSVASQKPVAKKPKINFANAPVLEVEDLADEEYVRNEYEAPQESDDDGLWSVERRHNAKAVVETKEDEAPQVTCQVLGNNGVKIIVDLTALDLAGVLKNAALVGLTTQTPSTSPGPAVSADEAATQTIATSKELTLVEGEDEVTGWKKLPPEIRAEIYKLLFKFNKPVELGKSNHSGSSHFLRTCKMVHEEGKAILYGANSFHFTRDTRVRGTYYDKTWKEVAYKDIRRFLEDIGPVNIGYLQHLSFQLTDATDNRTRVASGQIGAGKFVDDPHVHEIFRLIGANATLKTLALQFAGRAMVTSFDRSFLRAVTEVKCYKLVTIDHLYGRRHRSGYRVMERMKDIMYVRDENGNRAELDKPLYPVKMIYHETWTSHFSE